VERLQAAHVLRPFVRGYGIRTARLGATRVYTPLPARSDCFLEMYLEDRYDIVSVATGAVHRAPRLVLVGPHTRRREDLLLGGTLRVFTIRFTAVGFRALFGIPARVVADGAHDAEAVLGREVAELAERLASVMEPSAMATIADCFLERRLAGLQRPSAAVVRATTLLERRHGAVEIARLAAAHGVSTRQLERVFLEQVGVAPKTFGRLARLSYALDLRRKDAGKEWASIALAAGFFDQSHMVRDFRALTGETPERFMALSERARQYAVRTGSHKNVAFVLSGDTAGDLTSGA
jgi:AraC-like DNA-binding protein